MQQTNRVNAVQRLAGAMGIASWKTRATLKEYALASDAAGRILEKKGAGVATAVPSRWSVNEVGVTDGSMTSLWRHAQVGSTYAITSQAESQVLGGDLAIVDGADSLRIYQAKLVERVDTATNEYVLKSPLTHAHTFLLHTGTFDWDGRTFKKRGFLALYQQDLGLIPGTRTPTRSVWWAATATSVNAPPLGAVYYWDMMGGTQRNPARMASARGIMAAPIPPLPAPKKVDRVPLLDSWPWEFFVANVWTGPSAGGDSDDASPRSSQRYFEGAPSPLVVSTGDAVLSSDQRADFAARLFDDLYRDQPASLTVAFV
ncbi:hypothetical protein HN031_17745 [Nocardioides sp. zg-1308]|uniref:hypothetical protein n=1 Tax=Nocardioides sp. zg-1308 TaxID=2736253 RepID=UPI0015572FDA|nr:hypothetical protein [Nocardioides sp. zg-1308]NPD06522.1 hypothetical protein [Nocardioides sp. zg-1308]